MSTAAEGTFRGAGGVPIHWERAAPTTGPPAGVVLIAHGYAEHLGRYRHLIAHLTARGLAAAGIDHRGHGRSGGPRGHCLDLAEMVADLRLLAEEAARWWPGRPQLLFGHSMGGLIAFLYLVRHPETVRAGALSAPALRIPGGSSSGRWRTLLLLARLVPRLGLRSDIDAGALSRDPAVGAAYRADPLVHRRATAGFVRAIRAGQATAAAEAARLRVPVLILQGTADRIVDAEGARDIVARLTCPHEFDSLPGYYHELLNEPPVERAQVLALLDRWMDRWLRD
jgi:alpha-beta hydrolase superfamily lysophospholipase